MRLRIVKNVVQPDRINAANGEEGELVAWKRLKTEGQTLLNDRQLPFVLLLDMRSRLMQVRVDPNPDVAAVEVADGLVNAMCSYVPVPRSSLFIQRAVTDRTQVEWMVTDAVQVSGLLHRLKEAKEFDAPTTPPFPEPFRPIVKQLVDAVIRNMRIMAGWQRDTEYEGRFLYYHRFETHVWEMLRERFIAGTDDPEVLASFAKFFDLVALMEPQLQILLRLDHKASPRVHWVGEGAEAAQGILRHAQDQAERLGHHILRAYGTAEQQKESLGPLTN